ncbi:MAG: polysaccharide pyruvyl transferase family protein [Bacteroidaceae bacterium]|nr:polysaccharide pyruvyl transferase family protein [Bacteroidaceae bacterium]
MADYTSPCISQNSYKRILVRAGFDPLKDYKPLDFLNKNLVGDNLGNLLFAYGAMNVLWTENSSIKQMYDKSHYSDEEVDYINNNFDVFVMPMADAFRTSYITQLKSYTSLIQKLKIPVIVLGIGFRTTYEPQFCITPELDSIVKQFVSAVLEHSSKLGLRGEITATYLSKLGFKEDRDYVPIGCPSLYTYGNKPHIRGFSSFDKIKRGKLIFNTNTWAKNHFNEFIPRIDRFILDVLERFLTTI